MNILMITPEVDLSNDVRGFIHTWVSKIAGKCSKMHVLTMRSGETSLPSNVNLVSLDYSGNKLSFVLKFNLELMKLMLKGGVDIVFVHMSPILAVLAAPYSKIFGKPIVLWYTHGNVSSVLKISHLLLDKVVTASKESFRIKSNKVVVVGHGIDTDWFKPLEKKEEKDYLEILSVGRTSPVKNYETLIRAVDVLVNEKDIKNIRASIVGGPFFDLESNKQYFKKLGDMIQELRLGEYVKLVGAVPYPQILGHYQKCDIFVNTSLTGSLDKTGLEAMACSKPFLTCNESYVSLISEKFMFNKRDSGDLASKLQYLIQLNERQRDELGVSLRKIVVEEHNLEQLIKKLVKVFNNEVSLKKL